MDQGKRVVRTRLDLTRLMSKRTRRVVGLSQKNGWLVDCTNRLYRAIEVCNILCRDKTNTQ